MDLSLYLRTFWRFRMLVVCGFLLAVVLGLFSFVKVDFGNGFDVSYRDSEQWGSSSSVFVTQEGFPLGRSIYDEVVPVEPGSADPNGTSYVPRYVDPSRFSSYANLYARLAESDLLKHRLEEVAPLPGTISASAGVDQKNPGIVLPIVEIQGLAATAEGARATVARATRALVVYVEQQQRANKIALNRRVILRVLDDPSPPVLVVGRTKTRPVFVFVAVLIAFAALIFVLENLRPPRRRGTQDDESDASLSTPSRRSA
jgi:hypothetical protein